MTGDEMVIHLFAENADPPIARLAIDMLEKENPMMQSLKVKVKDKENSIWFNNGTNYGKSSTFQKEKYCKQCNSKTHYTSECWGPYEYCGPTKSQPG